MELNKGTKKQQVILFFFFFFFPLPQCSRINFFSNNNYFVTLTIFDIDFKKYNDELNLFPFFLFRETIEQPIEIKKIIIMIN